MRSMHGIRRFGIDGMEEILLMEEILQPVDIVNIL